MMYKPLLVLLAACLALWTATAAAQEEEIVEEALGDNAEQCISMRLVRRTEIVDDKNILFFMPRGVVYHNILPHRCGGLAREDRFGYETRMGRLCRLDSISVLYDDPFGVREGSRCSLGYFHKITKEDAEAIIEGPTGTPESRPLPMPEPEAPGEPEESEEPPVQ